MRDVVTPTSPSIEDQQTTHNSVSRPLRIVHLTTTAVGGGAAKVMLDIASAQRAAGHQVLAISILPRTPPPAWFGPEHGDWNDIVHLDWPLRYDQPLNLWEARRRLKVELDQFRPNVVHSHLWESDIVASLAVDPQACLHIAHVHCRDGWKESPAWKHRLRRTMTRQLFRRSQTRLIACSVAVRDFEAHRMRWPVDRIDVARNAVDCLRFQPALSRTSGRLRVGSAGWFLPIKGYGFLIDAVADIVAEDLDVELVIAGDGDLRREYLQQAADRGISDRLELPGSVADMAAFYRSLDVFVLPSLREGLPLVVLEAMACGRCIVAAAIPGMEQVVHSGVNGQLFEIGNRQSLTTVLRKLLHDRPMMERMGQASRRIAVDEFSPSVMTSEIESIYHKRLAERPISRTP